MNFKIITAMLFAGFAFAPAGAMAKTVLALATRAADFDAAMNKADLPLNDNGDTSISFRTTLNNTRVYITYNGKCGATGGSGGWLSLLITVDGNNTDPNNGEQFAMCGIVSSSQPLFTSGTRMVTTVVPLAGTHTVVVTGSGTTTGVNHMWFGESFLTVSK